MFAQALSTASRAAKHHGRRLAMLATAGVLTFSVPTAAVAQARHPAFAGTWKARDAVDDDERAAVIRIRRSGAGYELVDPTFHPTLHLRGKATGGRLRFLWKHQKQTTRFVYTLDRGGNALTEKRYDGPNHLDVHYLRQDGRHH